MIENITNKEYKVEIKLTDEYKKKIGITDPDYKQYYYINFVTREQHCTLHDGSYADFNIYSKHNDDNDALIIHRRNEFTALALAVNRQYEKELEEGRKYAEAHNILPAKWLQDLAKEKESNMNSNAANMNNRNGRKQGVVNFKYNKNMILIINNVNIALKKHGFYIYNDGYTHNHCIFSRRKTWILRKDDKDLMTLTMVALENKILLIPYIMYSEGKKLPIPIKNVASLKLTDELNNNEDKMIAFISDKIDFYAQTMIQIIEHGAESLKTPEE